MFDPNESLPLGGVLVGGQSRRFGSDKAAARIGDRSLAARAVDVLREVADPVVLLGGDGTVARRLALPWRGDETPGRGPLAGIAAGLRWASELERPGLVVLACDLPFVTSRTLRTLLAAARPGLDAVVAKTGEDPRVQPLCGAYAVSALPAVEAAIARGRLSVRALLEELVVEGVRVADEADEGESVLTNVNTPDDLEAALRRVSSAGER